jgi:hypothetical protein
MKTAMQLLLKEVTEARDISVDVNFRSALDFVRDAIEWDYIEKEKEQIKDAYKQGTCHHGDGYTATEYYEETFKANEK